jgi:ABC-2 type transport system ATP-binding protein
LSGDDALVVRDLSRHYGQVLALDHVSFSVSRGEVFGLLGPNGAGKTTLLETVEGLRPVESGSVEVCGFDVTRATPEVLRRIGVQLQGAEYLESLTVQQLLELFADLQGAPHGLAAVVSRTNLGELLGRRPQQLSGGQRQRLGLALAIIHEPDLLILDEPTSGLDPRARDQLKDIVRGLRDDGTTVILSTHYLPDAQDLCDRLLVLDRGRVVALGVLSDLIAEAGSLDRFYLDVTADD